MQQEGETGGTHVDLPHIHLQPQILNARQLTKFFSHPAASSCIQQEQCHILPSLQRSPCVTQPNGSAVWNTDWNVMWLIKWLYVKCMWRAPYISFLAPSPPHVLMHRSDFSHRSTDRFVFIDPKVLICSGAKQHLHTELLGKRFLETESKWIIAIIIMATTTKWDS